ncbi:unnamed protein product, partial [Sphacelaria rigidula]
MLLWPSAVRGSCKTTTGVPASPSTESPAKRGRSSRAGSSVVGTSPPPLSPKATSRSSFGDDYDRVDTPTAAAIKRGPPISPPSPFHLFAGTQLSPISKNCDLHHNSVDLQAAAGATST